MVREFEDRQLVAPLRRPTIEELISLGDRDYLAVDESEAEELAIIVDELLGVVESLSDLSGNQTDPAETATRWAGRRPLESENPWNAFVWFCDVESDAGGPLEGRLVGVKDNLDVAGIPTTNGSGMQPYTASLDAAVVERILAGGGRIVGKLNLDNFSSGGSGETSWFGAPLNPLNPKHSPGGSSGGSGAALASGAVDLALGVDQAGSARIPASYCGVVALKSTHGTVPTFGVTHLDHTLDAICPMARSVSDVELLYSVISGPDARDPQWLPERDASVSHSRRPRPESGSEGVDGVRLAVVQEGIDEEVCDPDVLEAFQSSIDLLRAGGAVVETISVPLWAQGYPIARPLLCHFVQAILASEGEGAGHFGLIDAERMHAFAVNRRRGGSFFPPNTKVWLLAGRYLNEYYFGASLALAQNLRLRLREELKDSLQTWECLLAPTTPFTAPELGPATLSASALVRQSRPQIAFNTAAANLSGHPALALPNGKDRAGLPTSIQLVGRYFDEPLLLRIGRYLEQATGPHASQTPEELAGARAMTIAALEPRDG